MTLTSKRTLCIICCGSAESPLSKKSREDQFELVKFCRQLVTLSEEQLHNNRKGDNRRTSKRREEIESKFATDMFIQSFEQFENLSLCSECSNSVCSAVKVKTKVDETEIYVRHMQLQILKDLRKLETQADEFYLEMKKIHNSIKNSDQTALESYIARGSPRKGGRSGSGGSATNGDDIASFRKQIEMVTKELGRPQNLQISERFSADFSYQSSSKERRRGKGRSSPAASSGSKLNNVRETEEDSDEDMEGDLCQDQQASSEAIKVEVISTGNHSPASSSEDLDHVDPDFDLADNMEDEEPASDKSDVDNDKQTDDRERTIKREGRSAWKALPAADLAEMEAELASLGLGKMSKPKNRLVSRVIRDRYKNLFRRKSRANAPPPSEWERNNDYCGRSTVFFDYNKDSGHLQLDNFQVVINEETNMMECSKCEYQVDFVSRRKTVPEQSMHLHIMHSHWDHFECPMCQKIYPTLKLYRSHLKIHAAYKCEHCEVALATKTTYKRHLYVRHQIEEAGPDMTRKDRVHPCPICGKKFKFKTDVKLHLRKDHKGQNRQITTERDGTKTYLCEVCSKGFARRNDLLRHKMSHAKKSDRPHACSLCSRRFSFRWLMERHIRVIHNSME